jgi:hypothetical protein
MKEGVSGCFVFFLLIFTLGIGLLFWPLLFASGNQLQINCLNCGHKWYPSRANSRARKKLPPRIKDRAEESLFYGIISFIPPVGPVTAPLSLIYGIIGLKEKKAAGQKAGKAIAGIVLSSAYLLLLIVGLSLYIFWPGALSSIPLPSILGQQSNSPDASSISNAKDISASFVAAINDAKKKGINCRTAQRIQANVIKNSAADSLIPALFTSKNPHNPSSNAYNRTLVVETDKGGAKTRAAAKSANIGQVRIGFIAPKNKNDNGAIVSAVKLKTKQPGTDEANVYCVVQPL